MRKTKSAILEAVHDTAKGLHQAGVMDQVTLREFDRLCLPPVEPLIRSKSSKSVKPRGSVRQSCRAVEHERFNGTEVGDRQEETYRYRTQAAASRAKAGPGAVA